MPSLQVHLKLSTNHDSFVNISILTIVLISLCTGLGQVHYGLTSQRRHFQIHPSLELVSCAAATALYWICYDGLHAGDDGIFRWYRRPVRNHYLKTKPNVPRPLLAPFPPSFQKYRSDEAGSCWQIPDGKSNILLPHTVLNIL
jgi:hypothetical protein